MLNFGANGRMITMQTNLSAMVAAGTPAGGEMSGLTAHFLFGANGAVFGKSRPFPNAQPGAATPAAKPLNRGRLSVKMTRRKSKIHGFLQSAKFEATKRNVTQGQWQ